MGLKEIIRRYLISETYVVEVEENEIKPEEIGVEQVPLGMRVILYSKQRRRKRLIDLSILKVIYERCSKDFVRDYLNLSISLLDIYKKYRAYNELEFLAICGEYRDLHEDLVKVLDKLKQFVKERNEIGISKNDIKPNY